MYYSKFQQEPSAFKNVDRVVTYENLKTKEKECWLFTKVVVVAYGSGRLRELFITEFK